MKRRNAFRLIPTGLALLAVAGCSEDPVSPTRTPPPPGNPAPPAPRVLVVNTLSETLSSLDLRTGEMTVQAATVGTWANRVTSTPGGRELLVTASGDNEVEILNAIDLSRRAGIDLGPGASPWTSVALSRGEAIVTNWLAGEVRRLDLGAGHAGPPLATTPAPEGVAVHDGRAWVACTNYRGGDDAFGEGRLDVVDLAAWRVIASIPVGLNPQDVLVDDVGRVHVLCTGSNGTGSDPVAGSAHVVDPDALARVGRVDLGGAPGRFARDAAGVVWVAGFSGGVRRYDAGTLETLPAPPDPALAASGLSAVAVDDVTGTIWITSFESDLLIAVDGETAAVRDVWLVGDGPIDVLVTRPD